MVKKLGKYVGGLTISGSNGIVASLIALPSEEIALLRALLGSLLLVGLLIFRRVAHREDDGELPRLATQDHPREALCLLASGAGMGLGWVFLFAAYPLAGVGISTLVYYTGPIIVMALSPLLFHSRLTPAQLVGFAVVAGGAFLVSAQGIEAGISPAGLLFALGAACCYTATVFFSKQVSHIHGLENAAVQTTGSLLAVVVSLLVTGQRLAGFGASMLLPVAVIGFVNTGLELFCYFTSIDELPVETVTVFGYWEPLSAVIFSSLLLGEAFGPLRLLGTACILGGALFCELAGQGVRLRLPHLGLSRQS